MFAMLDSPHHFRYLVPGALCLGAMVLLGGCARLSDTAQTMFVSTTPAVATVGSQVLTGRLSVYSDSSGFVALDADASQPAVLRCSGRLSNTGFTGRDIDLRCNNGVQARVALSMRTDLRGFGFGLDGDTPVGLAFGLEPSEVLALLRWPTPWRLDMLDGRYVVSTGAVAQPLPPVEAASNAAL